MLREEMIRYDTIRYEMIRYEKGRGDNQPAVATTEMVRYRRQQMVCVCAGFCLTFRLFAADPDSMSMQHCNMTAIEPGEPRKGHAGAARKATTVKPHAGAAGKAAVGRRMVHHDGHDGGRGSSAVVDERNREERTAKNTEEAAMLDANANML